MIDPKALGLMLNDPEYMNFIKKIYSNKKLLQLLSKDENFKNDPYWKLIFENPDAILQFMTPENIKLLSNIFLGTNK